MLDGDSELKRPFLGLRRGTHVQLVAIAIIWQSVRTKTRNRDILTVVGMLVQCSAIPKVPGDNIGNQIRLGRYIVSAMSAQNYGVSFWGKLNLSRLGARVVPGGLGGEKSVHRILATD